MQHTPEKFKNIITASQIFYLLFICSIFFQIRHVFIGKNSFVTGAYSDFTSISIYLSDIFLVISAFLTFFSRGKRKFHVVGNSEYFIFGLFVWIFIEFLLKLNNLTTLNLWFLFKFIELLVAYETTKIFLTQISYKWLIYKVFLCFTTLESILAIIQFKIQHSLGLELIKEPIFASNMPGIAKIVVNGEKLVRAYGTFPHPNLLAAFLTIGVIITTGFLFSEISKKQRFLASTILFINIVGLATTFSRSAFLATFCGLFLIYISILIKKYWSKLITKTLITTLLITLLTFLIFKPFLLTRATITDQATVQRELYNKIGLNIIKNYLVFGVGLGESVIHMQQFSPINLQTWQIQPIHNYFLLIAAEIGIPGALIMLWVFISAIFILSKKLIQETLLDIETLTILGITIAILILMQFDHYFYTLQQTQILLCVILAIITNKIKISNEYSQKI